VTSPDDPAAYAQTRFAQLLRDQIRNEFTAHQQYVALAVWFDFHDLPRLAAHFYQQAGEERGHAMMMVRYLLDRDVPVAVPGVDNVRNDFSRPRELVELALAQELEVTAQIENLFKVAREDGDVIAEQFVLWFLREQVEEVASMRTLLAVFTRAGDDEAHLFQVEDFLAREGIGDSGTRGAPSQAGA
jgi:ferritin